MKKLLFIVCSLVLTLVSCKPSPEEQLILDKEQSFLGSKIDLNMSIKSLECFDTITSKDSCEYYMNEYKEFCDKFETTPDSCISYLTGVKAQLESNIKMNEETLKKMYDYNSKFGYKFNVYKNERLRRQLKSLVNDADKYLDKAKDHKHNIDIYAGEDRVLGRKFKCTYTIINPLVKTKQELSKTYFISQDMKIERIDY